MRTPGFAVAAFALLTACGGGGSGSAVQPSVSNVIVRGKVTYEQVPFSAVSGGGLDFSRAVPAPVRGATVELIGSPNGTILASGVTDAAGDYQLAAAPNSDVFVRVKAELLRSGAPSWNVSVRDNTNFDALYALDGAVFNTGASTVTRNLHAASGFGTTSYNEFRSAAPFAILDSGYQALQLVLSANATAEFPDLRFEWSRNNRPVQPTGSNAAAVAAQLAVGNIGTTFFAAGAPNKIYVLGDASIDSDEFDRHVLAHEWGHYYQRAFSRDDSPGGAHSGNQRQDYRLAFSEGWGNAFSAMVNADPLYRDSFAQGTTARDFSIDVESNNAVFPGAFNESSVQSMIYDLYDTANDGADNASLGFGPIHRAMTGAPRTTRALTTIYPFLTELRSNAQAAAAVDALSAVQQMPSVTDDYGANEFNNGGDSRNLPLYRAPGLGATATLCSMAANGSYNRLGNRKFVRVDLPSPATLTVRASNGPAGSDPDLVLWGAGVLLGISRGLASGTETLTVAGLGAGSYVVELYEASNLTATPRGDTCFDLQVSTG